LAEQRTIGLILEYPIALSSALSKNEIGLILDNDSTALNSSAGQKYNRFNF